MLNLRAGYIALLSIFLLTVFIEKKVTHVSFYKLMPFFFTVSTFVYIYLGGLWHVYLRELLPTYNVAIADGDVLRVFLISNIAIQAIWLGSWYGRNITLIKRRSLADNKVPLSSIKIMILTSVGLILVAISIGAYGYTARDLETVTSTQDYSQYLNLGRELGMLGFITLVYFNFHRKRYRKYIFFTLVVFLVFGVLYGSKSVSLYFILALFVTKAFLGHKVSVVKNAMILFVSFYFVASIIEPFRQYYVHEDGPKTSVKSLSGLFSVYVSAYNSVGTEMESAFIPRIIDRLSYIIPAAKAVEYGDLNKNNVPEDYQLNHVFLAPVYALVPRFIWQDKPKLLFGRWFSKEVLGWSEITSVGITPQAYVYLSGGYFQIVLVFLFYGFIQRVMFNMWVLSNKAIPLYIFMYLKIGGLDDVSWAYLSSLIKMIVVYSLVYAVAKKVKPKNISYKNV